MPTWNLEVLEFSVPLQMVADRDKVTRAAVLATLSTAFVMEGPPLWRYLGRLTDAQRTILEASFKAAERQALTQGLEVGYVRRERIEVMGGEMVSE